MTESAAAAGPQDQGRPAGVADFATAAEQTLRDLHERVGLDSWWVCRRNGDEQHVLVAVDDVIGAAAGASMPWADSFCSAMLAGAAPQVAGRVEDVPAYAAARDRNGVPAASLLTVPIPSTTGEVLGTLCAVGVEEAEGLEAHLGTVQLAAGLLGALLSQEMRLVDDVNRAERTEHTDALTEVADRRGWDAALVAEEARAARYAGAVAVVSLDVEGLQRINEDSGHDAGDHVLRRVAALLRARVRSTDVVARVGGDEFALLLPETEAEGAAVVAEGIAAALAAAGIGVSWGASCRRRAGGTLAAWREADAARVASGSRGSVRSGAVPAPRRPLLVPSSSGPHPGGQRRDGVDALLAIITTQLGADAALVSTFVGDQRRVRNVVAGVEVPFGVGSTEPREGGCCPFAAAGAAGTEATGTGATGTQRSRPRSHAAVTLRRSGGEVYGSLCAFSHHPATDPVDRGEEVLRAFAGAVMDVVETEDRHEARRYDALERLDALYAAGGPTAVYQPVLALEGLVQVGSEALSRFPTGTPDPSQWFADAAEAGAGTGLELRAIGNAVAALPLLEGFLAINASPEAAATPGFARLVEGLPLHRLVLEITEHAPIEDYGLLTAALAPLRARGLRIAVDDTGAGFASMRHVLALVPDLIKLDISLVRGIDTDRSRQALTAALATFAAATGAQVIAEGIETAAELEELRRLGIGYGQGYHLARPAPIDVALSRQVPASV